MHEFSHAIAIMGIAFNAFPLNASSELWRKYSLGELWKIHDRATGEWAVRHVLYEPPADLPDNPGARRFAKMTVRSLQSRGAIFWQCHNALMGIAHMLGERTSQPHHRLHAARREELRDGERRVRPDEPLDSVLFGIPAEPELGRRRHVAGERRGGNHRRRCEITFAADAHAVLPVAIERGDRALTLRERIGPLAEAGTAPRLANLTADRPEHAGNRFALETRIGPFDPMCDAARTGKHDERPGSPADSRPPGMEDHERRLQQVVVAAVGAGADHRLVEGDALPRHLFGRKRVAGAEGLGDHRAHVGQRQRLVDPRELGLLGQVREDGEDVHEVERAVEKSGVRGGLVAVFVPGSTAGITTVEYERGMIADLRRYLDEAVPQDRRYAHNHGGDSNGHAHVRAALLGSSLAVPFANGELLLGTWQQIVLVDFDNRPRRRDVVVQLSGERG